MDTMTTAITTTFTMASQVSRVLHQTACNTKQNLFFQNTLSLPKISIDNFTGGSLKWQQCISFFKATIHNNSGLSDAQTMTNFQNFVTHKLTDFIGGFSYNADYYHEVITELTSEFGKPQLIVAAHLDELEKCPKPRLDEPNTFVSFSYFLKRLVRAFWLHNFEDDLKSSAVLRTARDDLNATMIIRRSQQTRSQALLQPNFTHFAEWIDS